MESIEGIGLDPFRSRDKIPRTPPMLDGTLISCDMTFATSPPDEDMDLSVSMIQMDPNRSRFFIKINDIPRPSGVGGKNMNKRSLGTSMLENSRIESNITTSAPSAVKATSEKVTGFDPSTAEEEVKEQIPLETTVKKRRPPGRPRKVDASNSSEPETVTVQKKPKSKLQNGITLSTLPNTSAISNTLQTAVHKPLSIGKEDDAHSKRRVSTSLSLETVTVNKKLRGKRQKVASLSSPELQTVVREPLAISKEDDEVTVKKKPAIPTFDPFPAIQRSKRRFHVENDEFTSTPKRVCNDDDDHFASTPVTIKQKRGPEDTPLAFTKRVISPEHSSELASRTPVTVIRRPTIRRRVTTKTVPRQLDLDASTTSSARYNLRKKNTSISETSSISNTTTTSMHKPLTRRRKKTTDFSVDEHLQESAISAANSSTSSVDPKGSQRSRRNIPRVKYAV